MPFSPLYGRAEPVRTARLVYGLRRAFLVGVLVWLATLQPAAPQPAGPLRLEVFKARRELHVYAGARRLRQYRIGLGHDPVSPKRREGDRATPEGDYFVCRKNPRSQFYLSLGLSYPNRADAARGVAEGLIDRRQRRAIERALAAKRCPPWNTPLGGEIFLHGHGASSDWTWGCVALDNDEMRELYRKVPLGTPVVIRP